MLLLKDSRHCEERSDEAISVPSSLNKRRYNIVMVLEAWQGKLKSFFASEDLPLGMKVYLFGSRARKDNTTRADIDLAFEGTNGFNIKNLDEKIDDLNIPYNIDLVDLGKVTEEFSRKAKSEGVLLFEKRS